MRCTRIACTVVLFALIAEGRARAVPMRPVGCVLDVAIEAPRGISFFDAPVIRVTGLPPLHPITISVTAGDPQQKAPAMTARYIADLSGVVDTSRSVANGDYEGVAVMGASKGAEAALLIGSYYPDRVRLVAALMPTHVVWEGIDARARFGGDPAYASPGKSGWSLNGKALPFVRKFVSAARLSRPPQGSVDQYTPMLGNPIDPAAVIPVERIRGPVFLASVGDDLAWPSLPMARAVKSRLSKRPNGAEVQLWEYPLAGQALGPPGIGTNLALGGTLSGNAQASQDVFARLRTFLRAHLGELPVQ